MKIVITLLTVFYCFSAPAYIPDYKMIMSRVAENHGRGIYQIKQDVVFPAEPESQLIEETWIISGEDALRVSLAGKGALKDLVKGTLVYTNAKRHFSSNGLKSTSLSADFVEPLFHFRFSKNIKPRLVSMGIAPSESLKDRPQHFGAETKNFPQQSFLRLARTGGAVAYAVGVPTPVEQSEENPGLWIEQDRFHVLKVRTRSGATVSTLETSEMSAKLWLPKTRQYVWGNSSAQVLINDVAPLAKDNKSQALFSPQSASDQPLTLPDVPAIREFYQRFR